MTARILQGDCREVLRTLPEESVHCCVTSPPYFGLRDYGVDGQMGLEPTPDEYIAGMVDVFREVRRVLRDDGTLWLNIGDSYARTGGTDRKVSETAAVGSTRNAMRQMSDRTQRAPLGLKGKNLIGIPWMLAFALRQPWTDWQIKDEAMRGWVAGLVDGEGCITIQQTKSSHSESLSYPPIVQVRMCDREPLDRLVAVAGSRIGEPQHPPSQVAANQRPSWQWKVSAERAAKIIAEIYPFLTCKRKQAIVAWNHQQFRTERGNQARAQSEIEREQFCKALINDLNQRKPVDLPSWMLEPKIIQEPGWYLRQDCIWHKPNPMPESVRDRCTKAHEYLFLLSKSPRYYFNADAIAEPTSGRLPGNVNAAKGQAAYEAGDDKQRTKAGLSAFAERARSKRDSFKREGSKREQAIPGQSVGTHRPARAESEYDLDTRNKRSVWTVATQPFKEAHFATFPPALVEPCVLAGCPQGGLVLDPFGGAGTTGLVADRLGRDAILVELNPAYAEIARKRIHGDSPLFARVANA